MIRRPSKIQKVSVIFRVNGVLNGVEVTNQDLHCYVVGTFLVYDFNDDILQVTADGRTYTAISRIPGTLGWDMQVLLIEIKIQITL